MEFDILLHEYEPFDYVSGATSRPRIPEKCTKVNHFV